MRRHLLGAWLGLLLWAPCASGATPSRTGEPSRAALPGATAAKLQRLLSESVAASGAMGAQAAVCVPGRATWTGVAGFDRPGEPMRADRMIGTGSISKMCTAIAAMVLIDRGKLSLGDTLGRWFPNTPNLDPGVTVRQMLQQTSGLGDYAASAEFRRNIQAEPGRRWSPEELLAWAGPPLFAPGKGWNAANTNRMLLGRIVERESGQSLDAFLRSAIFAGSPSNWVSGYGPVPPLLATHWFVGDSGRLVNANERLFTPSLLSARREVHASAADLAEFGARVFRGHLLSDSLRAEMLKIVPSDGKVQGETGGGLGIRQYGPLKPLARATLGHSGATGNNRALLLFDPATGIVAAVTINQGSGHGESHFVLAPVLLQAAIEFATQH